MGRFPRVSRFALVGIAGFAALLLIPGDEDRRPATSLKIGSEAQDDAVVVAAAAAAPREPAPAVVVPKDEPKDEMTVASIAPVEDIPAPDDSLPAVEEDDTPRRTLWVGRSAVNVRVGPSATTARLFVLRPGERVSASETSGNWTLIVAENGEGGWVSSRYLSDNPAAATATPPRAKKPPAQAKETQQARTEEPQLVRKVTFLPVSGRVTLRSRPSMFGARLYVLRPGERIAVIETRGRWVRVLLENGVSAWADGRDL